jgi:hypothetical protein
LPEYKDRYIPHIYIEQRTVTAANTVVEGHAQKLWRQFLIVGNEGPNFVPRRVDVTQSHGVVASRRDGRGHRFRHRHGLGDGLRHGTRHGGRWDGTQGTTGGDVEATGNGIGGPGGGSVVPSQDRAIRPDGQRSCELDAPLLDGATARLRAAGPSPVGEIREGIGVGGERENGNPIGVLGIHIVKGDNVRVGTAADATLVDANRLTLYNRGKENEQEEEAKKVGHCS